MKNNKVCKNFLIKKGTDKNRVQLIQLLNEFPPKGILSECSQKFRQLFLEYLLNNPLGVIVVAFENDTGVGTGYVIAIRHPVRFWNGLILRHPLSIDPILFIKKGGSFIKDMIFILKRSKKKNHSEFEEKLDNLSKFSWSPSGPQIARINFIGTLPNFRRLGIGKALYSFLAEILEKDGCSKIEAHIDQGNEASLILHQRTGWQIQKLRGGDYKAVLEL